MTLETGKQGLPIGDGARWGKLDVKVEREVEGMFGNGMTMIPEPRLVEWGQPS